MSGDPAQYPISYGLQHSSLRAPKHSPHGGPLWGRRGPKPPWRTQGRALHTPPVPQHGPQCTSVPSVHQCYRYAPVSPVCTSVPSMHQCYQCAPVSPVFTSVPSVHLDNRYLPVRHPQCGGYPLIMFSHACQKREAMPRVYFKTLRSRPGRHLWRRLCPQRYGRREAPQRFMLFSLSGYFERRE